MGDGMPVQKSGIAIKNRRGFVFTVSVVILFMVAMASTGSGAVAEERSARQAAKEILTSEGLANYLVNYSAFKGYWKSSYNRGDLRLVFEGTADELSAMVYDTDKYGNAVSPNRVSVTIDAAEKSVAFNTGKTPWTLSVKDTGDLRGCQTFPGACIIVRLKPKRQ